MRINVIGWLIGPAAAGPFFHAKGVFMILAGLLGLALCVFLIWWGRPIDGVMSPRVQRFELLFSTKVCLVFAAAVALIVVG
jgi:hypothetical protein